MLPVQISSLITLERLYVDDNRIPSVPFSIGVLTRLVELDVSKNIIDAAALPESLGDLQALRILKVHHNTITHFPMGLCRLNMLAEFEYDDALLAHPVQEVWEAGTVTIMKYLKALLNASDSGIVDLSNYNLGEVPAEVWTLSRISSLDLHSNNLMAIPSEDLNVCCTAYHIGDALLVQNVCQSVAVLSNLSHLDLSQNSISSVPLCLCEVDTLRSILLNDNEIAVLPWQVHTLILRLLRIALTLACRYVN